MSPFRRWLHNPLMYVAVVLVLLLLGWWWLWG